MTQPRLIPCLLLKNGLLVRSQNFEIYQAIGNPISTIERFSHWNIDELVILDISEDDYHDIRRDDHQVSYDGKSLLPLLRQISQVSFMPLAVGGKIRTLDDIQARLEAGADKCVINTQALLSPQFIQLAAERFGAQCIVVSIDVRKQNNDYWVYSHGGSEKTEYTLENWVKEVEAQGAGEIFLNSIDRDGSSEGYDLELIQRATSACSIPVIACGGVGKYEDFPRGILEGKAQAVSAANIFHFFELSYPYAKQACLQAGISMRNVRLNSKWFPREKEIPIFQRQKKLERTQVNLSKDRSRQRYVKWCSRCVAPAISATPIEFDTQGVCMACKMSDLKKSIPQEEWQRRHESLKSIFEAYRSKDGMNYDCVIPVSGGKDSYFQTYYVTQVLGMKPLLVTYNGNNYLDAGWKNVHRMKEAFDCDHIFYSPSVKVLKKLNKLAFYIMGDMNWHCHIGIKTLPVRMAVQHKVPLIIWGEHGHIDLSGQFSMNDMPEMNYRYRLEHLSRGYEWNYMVGLDGIREQDMIPFMYPDDQSLFDLKVKGIFLGNYVYWEANSHAQKMVDEYGFTVNQEPFERTYRTMSNLDDMHENGIHDYLKYIKFGYGRCTDHVCKDIRAGLMTREEGIQLVKKMDHVKSRDLDRWLKYVDMTETEFDRVADTFRDPRVWRKEAGKWFKDNIWDEVN